ncbi:unnamed protein product [Closterium sp. NIES-65]|nr:unnamed protein product [Closterium sp. NIES-65]
MATPSVLAFDAEGRAIDFEVWLDDLQLFLQCDRADDLSLFDLTSGAFPAPATDADPAVRSKWATRDAAARLAVRRHLPTSERAHFSQYKSAHTLYDAVVARYSSPATAALSRLMLPYLFPDLSAFPTVADLITHLRTSDTRYRAALPAEGALLPPCCPLLPLLLLPTCLVLSRSARRLPLVGDVAPARARGARARVELEGAVAVAAVAAGGVGVAAGLVAGVVVVVAAAAGTVVVVPAVVVEAAAGVEAAEVEAVEAAAEEAVVVEGGGAGRGGTQQRSGGGGGQRSQRQQQQRSRDIPSPQQLREWYAGRQRGGGTGPCTYVLCSGDRAGEQCGGAHATQRCFGRLTDAWRQQFPGASEIPRWDELLRADVAIFDLDFDAILTAIYVVDYSEENEGYRCFQPDPGIGTAALGACEAAALGASASALSGTGETALSADLQDGGVHQFTPASQRVTHCTEARTGRHLATFSRRPGSSLYTLTVESPPVPASGQVAASGQVLAAASRSGPSCVPCVEGRLRATPHSSHFPPTEAPLQTLHMDVWGPAPVRGQGYERYFLLVVDDYSRYTTVLPLRSKGAVTEVLIDWIREARSPAQEELRPRTFLFCVCTRTEAESSLLAFCGTTVVHGGSARPSRFRTHHSKMGLLSAALAWSWIVARTSMMHAAAPHFLWPFAVRYAAHQLNLHPRVSRPAMSPALLWTGKVGDASVFRVWGSRAFVRDLSADKLSLVLLPCVFLGFPTDAPGWQFYHPLLSSCSVLPGRHVSTSQSPSTVFFPYRTPSLPPPPDFLVPVDAVDPVEVTVTLVAAAGAEPGGADSGGAGRGVLSLGVLATAGGAGPEGSTAEGAEPGGAEPGGAVPGGAGSGGAGSGATEPGCAELGAAEPGGAASGAAEPGVSPAAASRREPLSSTGAARVVRSAAGGVLLSLEVLLELELELLRPSWVRCCRSQELLDLRVLLELELLRELVLSLLLLVLPLEVWVALVLSLRVLVQTLLRLELPARPRPYFVPLLQQVLGLSPPVEGPPPVQSQSLLEPSSPVPAPSPYTGPTGGLAERREPASRPASPSDSLRAASPTVTRLLATVVTDPSFESTAASALVAELVDFAARCRLDYAASLVAESASVCPPSVGGECALGTDVLEDRQEELQCLAAASPHLASVLLAPEGDPDALDIPTPRSYAEAVEGPYSSQWQAAMDAEMASWKSTGTYVDAVPPPGANIVSGMWIFRVKRPPGSPPVFKARYVARGFSQRQGVDYFQTFSPTPKMTTLRVLLHIAAQRDYELHSLDFSTAFLQGSLHEEIWLRRPPGFTGTFPPGTQWSLRRPVYGLRQAPREWHDTLRTTLAALGFAPSTADPSLFLRTDTSLPPFYILVYVDDLVFATADTAGLAYVKSELLKRHTCTDLGELRSYLGLQITRDRARRTITLTQSHMVQQVLQRFGFTYSSPQATPLPTRHSLSALPSDESVESSGPYAELTEHMAAAKRVLRYLCSTSGMGLVLGGRSPVVLTGHADASWADDQATQRSSQGYTFSLGSGSVSWRSTRSSSVLGSSCEAEIYAGAMAAQELRWLTYLLTDLGEPPRSPPVLYVDNKAMLALCREQRLEHRTKHIALRYFLARELQQRGQLRLAYVASEANTADVFTKALAPCDHQRFCTQLGLVPVLPHLLSS